MSYLVLARKYRPRDFAGLVARRTGELAQFTRTAGGAPIAEEHLVAPSEAEALVGPRWGTAQDEIGLLEGHDQELFLAAATTPVLFGAAVRATSSCCRSRLQTRTIDTPGTRTTRSNPGYNLGPASSTPSVALQRPAAAC